MENNMNLFVCIDDTDDLSKKISTGQIAAYILNDIKKNAIKVSPISRHQLFINKDINYTSHNSSMCFGVTIDKTFYEKLLTISISIINKYKAEVANPGLCVVDIDKVDKNRLVEYGLKCKKEVIKKEEAYALANQLKVHLSEHGGTGEGIIGALAGCALRLWGNDGELRGAIKTQEDNNKSTKEEFISARRLKELNNIDFVMTADNKEIEDSAMIEIKKGKNKIILRNNKSVFLVKEILNNDGNKYSCCSKEESRWLQENKNLLEQLKKQGKACDKFEVDVEEEILVEGISCINCLYRRFKDDGMECCK